MAIKANLFHPGWIQQKVSIRSLFDVFQTLFYLKLFLSIVDLTLYIQTFLLSYGCDNFLRIYSRGERYPSALCG